MTKHVFFHQLYYTNCLKVTVVSKEINASNNNKRVVFEIYRHENKSKNFITGHCP